MDADTPMETMEMETRERMESQHEVDTDRKITLRCSDGNVENVSVAVVKGSKVTVDGKEKRVKGSEVIAGMLDADDEAGDDLDVIPLPNISKATMEKIYEWMVYHYDPAHPVPTVVKPIKSASMKENIKDFPWDADWVDSLESEANQEVLFAVVLGANYLDCEPLLDLCCAKIASLLKNRTPKEIRAYFHINEPSPEEEEQIRKDNAWIFEIRPSDDAGAGTAGSTAA